MKEFDDSSDDDQEEILFEHYNFVVDPGQSPLRIDKFLINKLPNISRSKLSVTAKNGNIEVNGESVKANYKVKPGDSISLVYAHPKRELELIPQNIPLNIVFEDDYVTIVNKPANFVVHPGFGNYSGTLVNALIYHYGLLPKNQRSEEAFPGLVHRIDKDTTGLLVIAKTEDALNKLAAQFYNRTIDRHYYALVWGDVIEEEGTITGNIGRSHSDRKQMTVFEDGTEGKHAVTHYEVLERLGYVTLVKCKLDTGRTHQIRVHMKYLGHPLFGDVRYGGNRIVKGTTFTKYRQFINNCFSILPRQALHAKSIGFTHPVTGEYANFESDLPEDMVRVLDKWRTYAKSRHEDVN